MLKQSFTSAAVAAIASAVNTREFMNLMTDELVNDKLAQTATSAEAEAEGCGDTPRGQPVVYHGPSEYAPLLRANHTPGMNIMAQTEGMSGEAGPTPMKQHLAQSMDRKSRGKFA